MSRRRAPESTLTCRLTQDFLLARSTRFTVEVHVKTDLGVSFRKTGFGKNGGDVGAAAKSFFKNFTKGDNNGRGSPSESLAKSEVMEFLQVRTDEKWNWRGGHLDLPIH